MAPSRLYLLYNPVVRRRQKTLGVQHRARYAECVDWDVARDARRCCSMHRRRIRCACDRDAINISFPAPISFGFQCKCKTARNSRWQATRLADRTPAASLQRLHKTQRAALLAAADLSYTCSITTVDSIIRDTSNRVILIATSLRS